MPDPFNALTRLLLDGALHFDTTPDVAKEPDWQTGARVQAQVRAVVDASRVLLQIGEHVVDAKVPVPVSVGQRLNLRVVEPFPRLVFLLDATDAPPQTQVNLSQAARIIGQLVRPRSSSEPTVLRIDSPALPTSPDLGPELGEQIAQVLKHAIEKSGLFYERHQARWVAGDYPLQDLKQEPQARPLREGRSEPLPAQPMVKSREVGDPAQVVAGVTESTSDDPQIRATATTTSSPAGVETTTRAQLELVDNRGLTVALPGWEQRGIEWELPQRESEGSTEATEEHWSTRLRVDFPRLGTISAKVSVSGDKVALVLQMDSEERRAELTSHQSALMDRMAAAGLIVTHLSLAQKET